MHSSSGRLPGQRRHMGMSPAAICVALTRQAQHLQARQPHHWPQHQCAQAAAAACQLHLAQRGRQQVAQQGQAGDLVLRDVQLLQLHQGCDAPGECLQVAVVQAELLQGREGGQGGGGSC